jgi:hypothetical protein
MHIGVCVENLSKRIASDVCLSKGRSADFSSAPFHLLVSSGPDTPTKAGEIQHSDSIAAGGLRS